MLLTAGLLVLGGIATLSMVMMIGNVLSKSPYGKTWAMLGGLSVLLAAGLVILQFLVPGVDTMVMADGQEAKQENQGTTDQHAAEGEPEAEADADSPDEDATDEATGTDDQTTEAQPTDSNSPLADLSVLTSIMDLLKQGKAMPAEYVSLLDGAPGLIAEQSKVQAAPISKPLQSQLVSMNRSQGTSYQPSNSYVPSTKPATGGKTPTNKPSQAPAKSSGNTKTEQPTVPAPNRPPVTSQTPPAQQTPPPASQPPVSTTAALMDGGLLKSVLGKSKANVQNYFQFNQALGQEGNTLRFLRGATIVEVTFSGSDIASQVLLRFESFTPRDKSMDYYADYMSKVAGMTRTTATSRDSKNMYWSNAYPGASNVHFHIDTGANYGYVKANY